ncbi:MAG: DUF169 domain-containing protein [Thermoplasmatales archaeon]|jgi:uncharacterized protein (DUF169 family)|nr:DUF169 domain-containing protein [Thermoplasmatales archaeon]
MTDIKKVNSGYAEKFRSVLILRHDPIAVKLIRKGEEIPDGIKRPEGQRSHCQFISDAMAGACTLVLPEDLSCNVGTSSLGMIPTPEKIANGEYHFNLGLHESKDAAKKMIDTRTDLPPGSVIGEIVCPLNKADFVPDVVVFTDTPERIYWIAALETAETGGRMNYVTAPFQCMCEDSVVVPVVSGKPNISMGCYGTRRRTSVKQDEMMIGVPYDRMAPAMKILDRWKDGILTKAKRD